ncbi:MAG: DUF4177 domain-containing protein [Burkholderiales bacterium]|nr:DUF4177 domain-containing protein [Burkholderiales bacterium]
MVQYVYKCVNVPVEIHTGKSGKNSHAVVIKEYENIINAAAVDGWELVQVDSITSVQQPGCGSNKKAEEATFKLLIFKKPVEV